jgi:arginyl-tRNA synthetase
MLSNIFRINKAIFSIYFLVGAKVANFATKFESRYYMQLAQQIQQLAAASIQQLFNTPVEATQVTINETKPEYEGDYTIVLFAWVKQLGKSPNEIGELLGNHLKNTHPTIVSSYNIIKGFLNIVVTDGYWLPFITSQYQNKQYGNLPANNQKMMVEYSSPNTNKPLHLGHLRNNFLGWSTAALFKANGYDIVKTCIVNDRGIHICKSMLAWQQYANQATPESTGKKGDHFVGDYYVAFSNQLKKEVAELMNNGVTEKDAEKQAPSMLAAQQMLLQWEQGDASIIDLWKKMNSWVYSGFDTTYKRIGSDFDKVYYESETYLLGKDFVEKGLAAGVFTKKEDGSVWVDLTNEGLDEKLLLRKDGTSVYITQDIGLAERKYNDYNMHKSIYVIGDEQNYHMQVLIKIAQKLKLPKAEGIYHLSYGMVELTTGKMKSREGTVVDADDLIDEMEATAKAKTIELGKVKDFTEDELHSLYHTLALGAMKFFLLKVNPKKRMVFNPEESIDMHGFTGPFVQYTHARIKSILRQAPVYNTIEIKEALLADEKNVIKLLETYPNIIAEACNELDPSMIAMYCFNLAKCYNSFYANVSVLKAETEEKKQLRLQICELVAHVLQHGLGILGIHAPERM